MTKILKSITALLGLWLVVEVSVFSSGVALAIAFATAIAITAVALADVVLTYVRSRRVSTAVATAGLAAFLIVASLVFEGASLGWLMAIAGGAVQGLALVAIASPRYRLAVAQVTERQADAPPARLAA
ncbi:MAG: hypothetical protein ACRDON_00235 [Gaiellaceae bacterium]